MVDKKSSAKPVPSAKAGVKKQVNAVKKVFKKTPQKEVKPKLSEKEIVKIIVDLHNDGKTQSEIGLILKEKYNVKSLKKAIGKTVLQVLKEQKLANDLPEDLMFLLKRAVALLKHMKNNKKDMTAKRGYQLTVSKIRSLAKYYKKKGVLPKNWVYTETKAALLVK